MHLILSLSVFVFEMSLNSTAISGNLLCASCVLDVQSCRDTSDLEHDLKKKYMYLTELLFCDKRKFKRLDIAMMIRNG